MTRMDDLFAVSEFAKLTEEIRRSPSHLPACPLCSIVGQPDMPDAIRYPAAIVRRTDGRHGLIRCCPMSEDAGWYEDAASAAAWWRQKREQPLPCLATDARRRNVLAKLLAANLEPL